MKLPIILSILVFAIAPLAVFGEDSGDGEAGNNGFQVIGSSSDGDQNDSSGDPARTEGQVAGINTEHGCKTKETKTIRLGSNACGRGYCACVTPNRIYVPYRKRAEQICKFKGFDRVSNFRTKPGLRGVLHCGPRGTGCFINQNPGNLVCTQVTCLKEGDDPKITQEPNCGTEIFHPESKRCVPNTITGHENGYFFTASSVCIPTLSGAATHCTSMQQAYMGCNLEQLSPIAARIPVPSSNVNEPGSTEIYIRNMTDEGQCEKAPDEAFQRSCLTYFNCYNEAINNAKNKISSLQSSQALASTSDTEQLNDYFKSAKECHANFLAVLNGQEFDSEKLAEGESEEGQAGGGAEYNLGEFTQASVAPSPNVVAFDNLKEDELDVDKKGRSGEPPSVSLASGSSSLKSGAVAGADAAVKPVDDANKRGDSLYYERNNGGSGKGKYKNYSRGRGAVTVGGKSFKGKQKNKIGFGKKADRSLSANGKSTEKPRLFQMVSRQYEAYQPMLTTIDDYLRQLDRSN